MLPMNGVYISRTMLGRKYYQSVTNVGKRPTLEDADNVNAETHIIGIDRDLYGKKIKVELMERIRSEKKFANTQELQMQIQEDIACAVKYFKEFHLHIKEDMVK